MLKRFKFKKFMKAPTRSTTQNTYNAKAEKYIDITASELKNEWNLYTKVRYLLAILLITDLVETPERFVMISCDSST